MRYGFSLLELSIVLVIVGLLAGGVMTGQSLIRAAELRAVTTEYSRFLTAMQAFRDKYQALPGDIKNATAFWGKDNTNCAGNSGTAATPGTCNGNADGAITYPAAAGLTGETVQFWKQLALAGIIEGSYSGLAGANNAWHEPVGTSVPASQITTAGWGVNTTNISAGDGSSYALDYGNNFYFGRESSYGPYDPLLTPEEAWNIDTKLDDGKPANGKVIARYWNNQCARADDGTHAQTDLVASYKLTDPLPRCALYFTKQF